MRTLLLFVLLFCLNQIVFSQSSYKMDDFGLNIKFSPKEEMSIDICNLKIDTEYEYIFSFLRGDEPFEVTLSDGSTIQEILTFTTDKSCKSFDFISGPNVKRTEMLRLSLREKKQFDPKKQMVFGVNPTNNPIPIIEDIFQNNKCFEIIKSSITYKGNLGTYVNGDFLESSEGIIMSTGNVEYAEGPNNTSGNAPNNGGIVIDPDLNALSGGFDTYDVSTIEFDFIPTGGYIFFDYIFASEEYCDFVDSEYNDAFGFFISGPGINGNFSNNAENLAIVNGGDPVSINSINWRTNSDQYVSNVPQGQNQDGFGCTFQERAAVPEARQEFQFDGFTKSLTAFTEVKPCEVYHLKLAIADVSDNGYDSAVFLKANSFFAGGDAVLGAVANGSADDLIVYENCGDQELIITIDRGPESVLEENMIFGLEVSGTATIGEDYSFFLPFQEIPAFQESFDIPITVLSDNIAEGTETIEIQLSTACTCELPIIEIEIRELEPLNLELEAQPVCAGSEVFISSTVTGGAADYEYLWSNGFTSSSIDLNADNQDFFGLQVGDQCGNIVLDTIFLDILEAPSAILMGEALLCDESDFGELEIIIDGVGPFQIVLLNSTGTLDTINTEDRILTLPYSVSGEYQLISIEDECPGEVDGLASIVVSDLEIALFGQDLICHQDNDGKVDLQIQGGAAPYEVLWEDGSTDLSIESLGIGTYQVTVQDDNGCTLLSSLEIIEPSELQVVALSQGIATCLIPKAGSIALDVIGGVLPYSYTWNTGDTAESLSDLAAGEYIVTVTDQNGCSQVAYAEIPNDNSLPVVAATASATLNCNTTMVEINTVGSSEGLEFLYTWTNDAGEVMAITDPNTLSVSEAGLYTLTITNLTNGCSGEQAVLVEENLDTPEVNLLIPEVLNCINTSISVLIENQDSDFTYAWSSDNGGNIISDSTAANIDVDQGGQYQVLVTNTISGCTEIFQTEVIIDNAAPEVDAGNPFTIDCNHAGYFLNASTNLDLANAEIVWTSSNGNILNGANSLYPQINSGGNYLLTITNLNNGCVTVQSITIDEALEEPVFDFVEPDILTCNLSEVIVSIQNFDESLDLDFSWSQSGQALNNEIDSSVTVSQPGEYSLLVTNITTGCTSLQGITVDQNIVPPTATAGPDRTLDCFTDELTLGAIASLGSAYVYNWSTLNGVIVMGENTLTPTISVSGDYTLTVTNIETGCTAQSEVQVIPNDDAPIITSNQPDLLTCENQASTIFAEIENSTGDFSFSWTGPNSFFNQASLSIDVDQPGQYVLFVVNEDNGCESSFAVEVEQDLTLPQIAIDEPEKITCIVTTIQITTGLIDTDHSYTYLWSTVDGDIMSDPNSEDIEVNAPGTYTVDMINLQTGCTNTQEILVEANLALPEFLLVPENIIDCNNPVSLITIVAQDDIQLQSEWQIPLSSNVTLLELGDDQFSINQAGIYTLIITDVENGCTAAQEVEIQENLQTPLLEENIPVLINCLNSSSTLIVENLANMNLSYTWFDENQITLVDNENQISVIQSGQYSVLVTNLDNGCTEKIDFFIDENFTQPTANIVGDNLIDCEVSSVDLQSAQIDDNNIYTWLDASGSILSTSAEINIQEGGDYTLQVTNQLSQCVSEDKITVLQSDDLPQFNVSEPLILDCINTTTEIIINTTDPSLGFTLSAPTGGIVSVDFTVFGVDKPGIYYVYGYSSETTCDRFISVEVLQDIEPPVVDAGPGFKLGCIETSYQLNGSTNLMSNYNFEWFADTSANIVEGIETLSPIVSTGGIYSLLVTNLVNGCAAIDTVIVDQFTDTPRNIFVSVQEPPCAGDLAEIDIFEIDGGQGPYLFSIDDGNNYFDNGLFAELAPGEYELRIQDQNGCELDTRVSIPDTPEVFADLPEELILEFGDNAQLQAITNIDPVDIATITWSPATQLSCIDCLNPQVLGVEDELYTLTVVNKNGCEAQATIQLRVDLDINVYIPNAFSPINIDGINDVFMIFAKEGVVANINTFQVYDRWGNGVFIQENFQPNDILYGWDGSFREQTMNPGVFSYWAEIVFIDGTTQLFKGDVTLLD